MSEDATQAKGKQRVGLSRREFLKLAPVFLVGGAVAIKEIETTFYDGLRLGLTNPKVSDYVSSALLKVTENAPKSENSKFRSMVEIVKEGIESYERHSGKDAIFKRNPEYRDANYHGTVLKGITTKSLMPNNPLEVVKHFETSLTPELKAAYHSSSPRIHHFEQIFTKGSGFRERLFEKHSDCFDESGEIIQFSVEVVNKVVDAGREEINKLRRLVEKRRAETGKPVSTSFLLEHYLNENDGDIAKSLYDVALFTKVMARNDPQTGKQAHGQQQIEWYQSNILDEFQGPSYTQLIDHGEAINMIGKPYHSWNLTAMLHFFPTEMVRVGGYYKQLTTFKDQGLGKTRSDFQTLKDLRGVEQLLVARLGES